MESLDDVSIHPGIPNHKVQIGALLRPDICLSLIEFLKQQHDCFAWSHTNITDIDPEVTIHHLRVSYPLVRQKQRKFAPERNFIINEEVQKLIDIGSVREV